MYFNWLIRVDKIAAARNYFKVMTMLKMMRLVCNTFSTLCSNIFHVATCSTFSTLCSDIFDVATCSTLNVETLNTIYVQYIDNDIYGYISNIISIVYAFVAILLKCFGVVQLS